MSTQFRELIRPGTNYEFVSKGRMFFMLSMLLVIASIAMLFVNRAIPSRGTVLNWTIDFKGGTEMIVAFGRPVAAGELRQALDAGGNKNADVSAFTFTEQGQEKTGFLLRFPEFGALEAKEAGRIADEAIKRFSTGDRKVLKATWSGDNFYLRTTGPLTYQELSDFLRAQGLEPRAWSSEQEKEHATPKAGTNEYDYEISVYGLDRKIEQALTAGLSTQVEIKQVDAVGPKAGEELRNDGLKSLVYAIALILLYIAFRFDFRYGPGTVAALVHDAILVVGVFAVTWTEFSLTTVAALLTVIGYSMNDTVVVFDRIRENEARYRDKRLDRVINISINETLSRTMLTTLTTFSVTLAMNILGTGLVKNFAFAMNVGIIVGTYSSIFVASPIILWLHHKYWSKRSVAKARLATSES